ncbi:Ig-like domain-containing protein [Streptomyces sp. NPDC051041]|uniref:L,D-transpeptidase n=1 Tax=Streptomyces sp. NPDC051041 TaxID=3365640 RepID=UPI0037B9A987
MSHTADSRGAAAGPRTPAAVGCTLLVIALGAGATSCDSGHPLAAEPYDATDRISFSGSLGPGKKADPDQPLEVVAKDPDGRITDVTVHDATGRYVAGELAADGSRWHSTSPLAAGARYTVRVSTEDQDGAPGRKVITFDTGRPLTKKRLNVDLGPGKGTYGVGRPVTAELNRPVRDRAQRAVVERALKVDSTPAVQGAWHWVNDRELHYRPKEYWPAHATVRVRSNLAGIKVGDRLWGGTAEPLEFSTGDRVEALTDAAAHWMKVYKNGKEVRTIPVTTGKPGFETRNGIKVVLGKERFVRMRSSTLGIAEDSAESYDLPVHFATRVTWSGEYLHAAPWSEGSQGSANVSHGCTGMSTENAKWFFENVREGDVVKVVNSRGETMTPFGNGFGDWNLPWRKWRQGSALTTGDPDGPAPAGRAGLRPQSR